MSCRCAFGGMFVLPHDRSGIPPDYLFLHQQVKISYSYIFDPLLKGNVPISIRQRSRSEGHIRHIKMGMKGQKAIGNIGTGGRNEPRNVPYLPLIHIAGNEKGTRNEEGRRWPLAILLPCTPEVFQSSFIAHAR